MPGHTDFAKPLTPDEGAVADEYEALAHAMQSGVAAAMGAGDPLTEPKHLRVGVNSCMVNDAAVADLLIAKGVFTRLEYLIAVRDRMRAEVEMLEAELTARSGGVTIKLK